MYINMDESHKIVMNEKRQKKYSVVLLYKCQNPENLKIYCQGHRYVLISALARER